MGGPAPNVHNHAPADIVHANADGIPRGPGIDKDGDTIVVDVPPGHDDYPSEDEAMAVDIPEEFNNSEWSTARRDGAISMWRKNRKKLERKAREKSSHVCCISTFMLPFHIVFTLYPIRFNVVCSAPPGLLLLFTQNNRRNAVRKR